MEFRILGPLHVAGPGGPIAIDAGKVRALLELLLLHANEVIPTDRLVDSLWGDSPPDTAEHAVEVHVSRLRRALGADRLETPGRLPHPGRPGRAGPPALRVAHGRGPTGSACERRALAVRLLREAEGLWRGPPVADLGSSDRMQAEIARLDELHLAETEARIDAMLAVGSDAELVPELDELVAAQPFRERFQAQLMLALYRSGRQVDALEAFQAARLALNEDLGSNPGPDLQELQRAILRQDPALDVGSVASGGMLEIDLLGQFRLLADGQAIDGLRNPRLLAYVVLNRDRNLTREEVAFALWPDSGDAQALTNLRRELHAIRHALPAADRYLGLDHRTIRLNADAVALDVAQFESAVADPAADLEALRAGIERYRGDLVPGIYDDWLEPHRERLRTMFVEALARLADRLEERGEYRDAMAVTRRLITVDALDERAYRALIRQAAAAGDRSAGVHALPRLCHGPQRRAGRLAEPRDASSVRSPARERSPR